MYLLFEVFLQNHQISPVAWRVKNLPAVQETWVQSLGQDDPIEKEWLPTPVFLPGEFHGQRNLVGYNPWDRKESGMTELLTFTFIIIVGLPRWLSGKESTCQCRKHGFDPWVGKIPWRRKWQSTLVIVSGDSMDRGTCWATVHGVAELDTTEQLTLSLSWDLRSTGRDR